MPWSARVTMVPFRGSRILMVGNDDGSRTTLGAACAPPGACAPAGIGTAMTNASTTASQAWNCLTRPLKRLSHFIKFPHFQILLLAPVVNTEPPQGTRTPQGYPILVARCSASVRPSFPTSRVVTASSPRAWRIVAPGRTHPHRGTAALAGRASVRAHGWVRSSGT